MVNCSRCETRLMLQRDGVSGCPTCGYEDYASAEHDPMRGAWGVRTHRLIWTDDAIGTNTTLLKSEPDERARVLAVLKALR